jgi:hypothetical protein
MRVAVTRLSEEVYEPGSDGVGWRTWSAICVVLITVFAGFPLFREEANGACQAVELRALSINFASTVAKNRDNPMVGVIAEGFRRGMATGEVMAAIVRDRYPAVPSPISCAALYWQGLFDPTSLQIAATR